MREASELDFTLPLDGVGDFVMGRRTIGDIIKIRTKYAQLMQGIESDTDNELSFFAGIIAAYSTLVVSCPQGWEDLSKLDDANSYDKVVELSNLLTEKEKTFRVATKVASKE